VAWRCNELSCRGKALIRNGKAEPRLAEQRSRKESETNTIKTEDLTMEKALKIRLTLLEEALGSSPSNEDL
jgi:hypothetical protein